MTDQPTAGVALKPLTKAQRSSLFHAIRSGSVEVDGRWSVWDALCAHGLIQISEYRIGFYRARPTAKALETYRSEIGIDATPASGAVEAAPGDWLIREDDGGWYWTGTRIAAVAALTEGREVIGLPALLSAGRGEEGVRGAAQFLYDRLEELSTDVFTEDGIRDWCGHVSPAIARLRTALSLPAGGEDEAWLEWLAKDKTLELMFGYPDEPEDPGCWMVHQRSGGRSDREWALIGRGSTPRGALISAARKGGETEPCGGCGESDPAKRCIGCLHDFNPKGEPK